MKQLTLMHFRNEDFPTYAVPADRAESFLATYNNSDRAPDWSAGRTVVSLGDGF